MWYSKRKLFIMATKKEIQVTTSNTDQLEVSVDTTMGSAVEASSAPELPKGLRVSAKKTKASHTVASSTEEASDDIAVPPVNIDTPESDAAIDDIIAQEADQVLAAEDAGIRAARQNAEAGYEPPKKPHGHPIFWFLILLIVIIAFLTFYVLTSPGLELQSPFSM